MNYSALIENRKSVRAFTDKEVSSAILEQKKFGPGIKELLQEKASLSESVLQYKNTNMYVLYARKAEQNIGDMIASHRMEVLLDWARKNFSYVVLDLPPMAAVSDAEAVMEFADASLLIVRQNVAFASELNNAIGNLEGHPAKMLGCVLNNVFSTQLSSGQSYGYGSYNNYKKYGHYGNSGSHGLKK